MISNALIFSRCKMLYTAFTKQGKPHVTKELPVPASSDDMGDLLDDVTDAFDATDEEYGWIENENGTVVHGIKSSNLEKTEMKKKYFIYDPHGKLIDTEIDSNSDDVRLMLDEREIDYGWVENEDGVVVFGIKPANVKRALKPLRWISPVDRGNYYYAENRLRIQFEIMRLRGEETIYLLLPPGASSTYTFPTLEKAQEKAFELYSDIIDDLFE